MPRLPQPGHLPRQASPQNRLSGWCGRRQSCLPTAHRAAPRCWARCLPLPVECTCTQPGQGRTSASSPRPSSSCSCSSECDPPPPGSDAVGPRAGRRAPPQSDGRTPRGEGPCVGVRAPPGAGPSCELDHRGPWIWQLWAAFPRPAAAARARRRALGRGGPREATACRQSERGAARGQFSPPARGAFP